MGKPTLIVTKKIARIFFTGQKIKLKGEFITNVMLNEKMFKLRRLWPIKSRTTSSNIHKAAM